MILEEIFVHLLMITKTIMIIRVWYINPILNTTINFFLHKTFQMFFFFF